MNEATAKDLFLGKDRLNCAQAVLTAFQPLTGMGAEEIASFKHAGNGRAEGGVCGAAHALRYLARTHEELDELFRRFAEETGSLHCKEIRKARRATCRECVGIAARLVEERIVGRPTADDGPRTADDGR